MCRAFFFFSDQTVLTTSAVNSTNLEGPYSFLQDALLVLSSMFYVGEFFHLIWEGSCYFVFLHSLLYMHSI